MTVFGRGIILLLVIGTSAVLALDDSDYIEFDSGVKLPPVDESELEPPLDTDLADPKDTGSHLFHVDDPDDVNLRLTLNFRIADFKSEQSEYYRAHPIFMRCLQKVYNYIKDTSPSGHKIQIVSGYKTVSEVSEQPSEHEQYARSGCGATVTYQSQSGEERPLLDIAQAAIIHCMPMFGSEMQDLGLVMLSDAVHIHMAGSSDIQPYFDTDGFPDMTSDEFKDWAWDMVDETHDPLKTPQCEGISALEPGHTYPPDTASPEDIVGEMDVNIARNMTDDFRRMIQFADSDRHLEFVGCDSRMEGHAESSRCSSRVMSTRLYAGVRMLQKMVREHITGNKLKVLEAWDENQNDVTQSLHYEGRAATVQLTTDTDTEKTSTLSRLAVCAGIDYVKHEGDHITVAVRMQAGTTPLTTAFPETEVLEVVPPSEKEEHYVLPDEQQEETETYPLFDSDHQDSVRLGQYAKVSMFSSQDADYRYYRVHPAMVHCYESVVRLQHKWSQDPMEVSVVRSFLSRTELEDYIDPESDPRGYSYTLGLALQLRYGGQPREGNNNNDTHTSLHTLADVVVQECGPIFFQHDSEMGIGLYHDSLYVDMREIFQVWTEDESLLPTRTHLQSYSNQLAQRLLWAIEGRIIDPDHPEEALAREVNPPQKQSPEYRHQPPAQASDPDACVPQTNTDFCIESKPHRDDEVDRIWVETKRLHLEHDENELKAALTGCMGTCGTCVRGHIYDEKAEHCDNLLHWSPFRMLNTAENATNLFHRDNPEMRQLACEGDRHCLDEAPLYARLASSLDAVYRPHPDHSVIMDLYAVNDNPSPVLDLILGLYSVEAVGTFHVWVDGQRELKDLRNPIKVALVYNVDVTDVIVHVAHEDDVAAVEQTLQDMITDWTRTTHTKYSREAIPSVNVRHVASEMVAKSVDGKMSAKGVKIK